MFAAAAAGALDDADDKENRKEDKRQRHAPAAAAASASSLSAAAAGQLHRELDEVAKVIEDVGYCFTYHKQGKADSPSKRMLAAAVARLASCAAAPLSGAGVAASPSHAALAVAASSLPSAPAAAASSSSSSAAAASFSSAAVGLPVSCAGCQLPFESADGAARRGDVLCSSCIKQDPGLLNGTVMCPYAHGSQQISRVPREPRLAARLCRRRISGSFYWSLRIK